MDIAHKLHSMLIRALLCVIKAQIKSQYAGLELVIIISTGSFVRLNMRNVLPIWSGKYEMREDGRLFINA